MNNYGDFYKDFLNQEIVKYCKKYEEEKENIINELKSLTINIASEFNAEIIAQIGRLTEYAVKIETLSKLFTVYENAQDGAYTRIEILR